VVCFLPNLDNRTAVVHELHIAIDRRLREEGIEIAFPQHDIRVRSIDVPLSAALPWSAAGNATAREKAA